MSTSQPYQQCQHPPPPHIHSSLAHSFHVFSEQPHAFVTGLDNNTYTTATLDDIEHTWRTRYGDATHCHTFVCDFEGERLGYGGELLTAAFVPVATHDNTCASSRTGVLIDMTCARGIAFCKWLMEAAHLTKWVWGATSDLAALVHQHHPRTLGIVPTALVDVQLLFSERLTRRLALKHAVRAVCNAMPNTPLRQLPAKAHVIDWDAAYAKDKNAIPFPLSHTHVQYALDDLHRVELVVCSACADTGGADADATATHNAPDTAGSALADLLISVPAPPKLALPSPIASLQQQHTWSACIGLSQKAQQDIVADPYGMRWFYVQRKGYRTACRYNHPRNQRLRRQNVMRRHVANVLRQCGGTWDDVRKVLSPSDVRALGEVFTG